MRGIWYFIREYDEKAEKRKRGRNAFLFLTNYGKRTASCARRVVRERNKDIINKK